MKKRNSRRSGEKRDLSRTKLIFRGYYFTFLVIYLYNLEKSYNEVAFKEHVPSHGRLRLF